MENFVHSIPTELYFGKGQIAKLGDAREFDNLIRYEVHQSQIWLIFFVKS